MKKTIKFAKPFVNVQLGPRSDLVGKKIMVEQLVTLSL